MQVDSSGLFARHVLSKYLIFLDNPISGLPRRINNDRPTHQMPKSLYSERHQKLARMLLARRKASGMTQAEVARALGRHQPFIANIENGERRVDLIELLELSEIIGSDIQEVIEELKNA
jgi:DNA-binding XRE family transcriptional regulator